MSSRGKVMSKIVVECTELIEKKLLKLDAAEKHAVLHLLITYAVERQQSIENSEFQRTNKENGE